VVSGPYSPAGHWSTNGTLVRTLNHAFSPVSDAAFSPDGRFVAVLYPAHWQNVPAEIVVYDVASGNPATSGAPPESFRLGPSDTYSTDGRWQAKFSDGAVWMGGTGTWPIGGGVLESFWGRAVPGMAFAPDNGTLLVAGTYDNTLKFWGTLSYRLAQIYTNEVAGGAPCIIEDDEYNHIVGEWTGATAVAFSGDRQFFAYGRVDGTVVLARNPFGATVHMSASREGNGVRLGWQGGNRYYQLQRTTDIVHGPWLDFPGPTTDTNTLLAPGSTNGAVFYRVLNCGN
jgi:WD40 repeat protein